MIKKTKYFFECAYWRTRSKIQGLIHKITGKCCQNCKWHIENRWTCRKKHNQWQAQFFLCWENGSGEKFAIKTVGDLIKELERFPKDLLVYIDRFESDYHITDKWNIESVDIDAMKMNESSMPFVKIIPYDGLERTLSECKCEIRNSI